MKKTVMNINFPNRGGTRQRIRVKKATHRWTIFYIEDAIPKKLQTKGGGSRSIGRGKEREKKTLNQE